MPAQMCIATQYDIQRTYRGDIVGVFELTTHGLLNIPFGSLSEERVTKIEGYFDYRVEVWILIIS
jgi:hypothetical protein